ncbi:hypothetical protein ACHAXT_012914 [Thalassiosira profunda]
MAGSNQSTMISLEVDNESDLPKLLEGRTIAILGGPLDNYTAEAYEPARRRQLHDQLQRARSLRASLEEAADRADALPNDSPASCPTAMAILQESLPQMNELVRLTEALRGNQPIGDPAEYDEWNEWTAKKNEEEGARGKRERQVLRRQLREFAREKNHGLKLDGELEKRHDSLMHKPTVGGHQRGVGYDDKRWEEYTPRESGGESDEEFARKPRARRKRRHSPERTRGTVGVVRVGDDGGIPIRGRSTRTAKVARKMKRDESFDVVMSEDTPADQRKTPPEQLKPPPELLAAPIPGAKSGWTEEEDEQVIQLHAQLGNNWIKIAQEMPGRSDQGVKNRWYGSLTSRGKRKPARKVKEEIVADEPASIPTASRKPSYTLGEGIADAEWHCPSCLGSCQCETCTKERKRKDEKEKSRSETGRSSSRRSAGGTYSYFF